MTTEQAKYYCNHFFSLLTEEERELYSGSNCNICGGKNGNCYCFDMETGQHG